MLSFRSSLRPTSGSSLARFFDASCAIALCLTATSAALHCTSTRSFSACSCAWRSASALALSTSSRALASASSRARRSASSWCCFSSLLTCLRQCLSFILASRTDASSSLLDWSSGVVAFVQSLDPTTAGATGVANLAGADMLLEGKKLGVKEKNWSDLYTSKFRTQTITPDSALC